MGGIHPLYHGQSALLHGYGRLKSLSPAVKGTVLYRLPTGQGGKHLLHKPLPIQIPANLGKPLRRPLLGAEKEIVGVDHAAPVDTRQGLGQGALARCAPPLNGENYGAILQKCIELGKQRQEIGVAVGDHTVRGCVSLPKCLGVVNGGIAHSPPRLQLLLKLMGIQRNLTRLDHLPNGDDHILQPLLALGLGLGGGQKQIRQGLGSQSVIQPRKMHPTVLTRKTVGPRIGLGIHTPVLSADIGQRGLPIRHQMLAPEGALKQELEKIMNLKRGVVPTMLGKSGETHIRSAPRPAPPASCPRIGRRSGRRRYRTDRCPSR